MHVRWPVARRECAHVLIARLAPYEQNAGRRKPFRYTLPKSIPRMPIRPGDSLVTGLVVILLLIAFDVACPLALAVGLSIRRHKIRLIRDLVGTDRWTQDVVLSELDPKTRTECLRRLGRYAN